MATTLMAAFGYGAKELFSYNRENFKFDQDQKLEREVMQLEMQIKRFELFREDIRDLVELTVGRMDIYHLVGALFLEFCMVLFCEGRVRASAPTFILKLFLLTNSAAFVYLLLAVWLSMHASVASHSFGVRLLTRFVRLPIPSSTQIDTLNNQLAHFEKQELSQMLRLPGTAANEFERPGAKGNPEPSESQMLRLPVPAAPLEPAMQRGSRRSWSSASGGSSRQVSPRSLRQSRASSMISERVQSLPESARGSQQLQIEMSPPRSPHGSIRLPGGMLADRESSFFETRGRMIRQTTPPFPEDETGLPVVGAPDFPAEKNPFDAGQITTDTEQFFAGASQAGLPGQHIQLFRQLQAKWQCYDAYCRVCMSLGVNQILQALSFFSIAHTLIENRAPAVGYAMLAVFQAAAFALAILDIAGIRRRNIAFVQLAGSLPAIIAATEVTLAKRDENGALDPWNHYYFAWLAFLFQAIWLQLLLWVSSPSADYSGLPRKLRAVLFLDVFRDASHFNQQSDPANRRSSSMDMVDINPDYDGFIEDEDAEYLVEPPEEEDGEEEAKLRREKALQAEVQLKLAQFALRRWGTVPPEKLSEEQGREFSELMCSLLSCGRKVDAEIRRLSAWGVMDDHFEAPLTRAASTANTRVFEDPLRAWGDLSESAKAEDPFCNALLGPLRAVDGQDYYFDVEESRLVSGEDAQQKNPKKLPFSSCVDIIKDLEESVGVLTSSNIKDLRSSLHTSELARRRRERSLSALQDDCFSSSTDDGNFDRFDRQTSPFSVGYESIDERFDGYGSERSPLDRGAYDSGIQQAVQVPLSTADRVAGPSAADFVPMRLPWQVLKGMTRVMQLCWLSMSLISILKDCGIVVVDFPTNHPGGNNPGEREFALCSLTPGRWSFEPVEVIAWPHGAFFRPETLSCIPLATGSRSTSGLLVGSPYAIYKGEFLEGNGSRQLDATPQPSSLSLKELEHLGASSPFSSLSSVATTLCGGDFPTQAGAASSSCLLGAPDSEGIVLQPLFGQGSDGESGLSALLLPVNGKPWLSLAGAAVRCSRLPKSLKASTRRSGSAAQSEWCLLLAGWDGERIPVAAVALPGRPGELPAAGSRIQPRFDAPLSPRDVEQGLTSLHLEPESGRLWAIMGGGDLQAWDLLAPRSLGRWRPFASRKLFHPSALCEAENSLFVVGRTDAVGPTILRANLPLEIWSGYLGHAADDTGVPLDTFSVHLV